MQGAHTISTKTSYIPFITKQYTHQSMRNEYIDQVAEMMRLACPKVKETFSVDFTMSTSSESGVCELPAIEVPIDWTEIVLNNLDELFEECSEPNWDGYQAIPISHEAYSEAIKLINLLPASYPQPDITPEPDGGIGFEWHRRKGHTFIISVYGKNAISYAGIFGSGNEIHGSERFSNLIPPLILESLKRLFI